MRAHKIERPAAAPVDASTLPVALTRDGCARCGVPGFKGCEHQRPYGSDDADLPPTHDYKAAARAAAGAQA